MLIKNNLIPYPHKILLFTKYIFLFNLTIFFATTAIFREWAKDFAHMTFLCSFFGLLIAGRARVTQDTVYYSLICLCFFLYACFSYFYHPQTIHTGPQLEVQAKFLLVIPVAALLYYTKPSLHFLAVLNTILAFSAGTVAIIYFDQKTPLPEFVQKQAFGNLSVLSAFTLLFFVVYSNDILSKIIYLIAACFGVLASFWCDTRTGWIAMPFYLILLGAYTYQQYPQYRKLYVLGLVLAISIVILYQEKLHIIEPLKLGLKNTVDYLSGKEMPPGGTSLGMRFEMWYAALLAVKTDPLFGIGIGNTQQWIISLIDQGIISHELKAFRFKSFHNTFIGTLATQGIIGLCLLIYMLYWLTQLFIRLKQKSCQENKFLGYLGLLLLIAYCIYALTDDVFSSTMTISYFLIFSTFIIYLSGTKSKDQESS